MKHHLHVRNILNAEDKFSVHRELDLLPDNLTQLGELAIAMLNDKNLDVSEVRPFFWSMVEAYVDRFHIYPFDVNRALFSYLELKNYPEDKTLELVKQLELQFEQCHGRPLRNLEENSEQLDVQDDGIKILRDCMKYAAMIPEDSSPEKKSED